MKEKLEQVKAFVKTDWTMPEKILVAADLLLLGVLVGWLTSPFPKGIHRFSNDTIKTGNSNGIRHDQYKEEEEEC